MTKKYIINGKEIERLDLTGEEVRRMCDGSAKVADKLIEIMKALNEEKEGSVQIKHTTHKGYNVATVSIKIDGKTPESLGYMMTNWDAKTGEMTFVGSGKEEEEEKYYPCADCGTLVEGPCDKHNPCKQEPKSTLNAPPLLDLIEDIINNQSEYVSPKHKILSLFKDTLLKEVKKAEPLRLQGESTDFTQGQEWTMTQIKQIIKNI